MKQLDKSDDIILSVLLNGRYVDITAQCHTTSINFNIFDINGKLTFVFRDVYDLELSIGDVIECRILNYTSTTPIITTIHFKVFSIRFFKSIETDKDKMENIIDCVDIHSFHTFEFLPSKFYSGNISSIITNYIKDVWTDDGINNLNFPLTLNVDDVPKILPEFLSCKIASIREIENLLAMSETLVAYRSLKALNIKNITSLIPLLGITKPSVIINEKKSVENQSAVYSFQYNYNFLDAMKNGMIGYNLNLWDKELNKYVSVHDKKNRIINPDYVPTLKYYVTPNYFLNYGTTMLYSEQKLYDIGETFSYTAMKPNSQYSGIYTIIDVNILMIKPKQISYSYKLYKLPYQNDKQTNLI